MTSTSVKVIWADFGSIFTRLTRNLLIFNPCAQDETRTHTILRPLPPQSSVYTNFTTCASRQRRLNTIRDQVAHMNFRRAFALQSDYRCTSSPPDFFKDRLKR